MRQMFAQAPKLERRAALASLVVGVALLAVKFTAYFLTGSTAIFSDALESIVNVVASAFALYSILLAHAPADAEHPYGHGKVEFLSAALEGGMLLLAALVIFSQAIEGLARHNHPQGVLSGLVLMAVAMFVNGALGLYLLRIGRSHKSLTLEADGKHLLTDVVTSLAVLASLVIYSRTRWWWIDAVAALAVAVYIIGTSAGLLRQAAAGLMDEQDQADQALLTALLDSHVGPDARAPRICSYHKLRHRHSGRYQWVDFHIRVPSGWNVRQGHGVASVIEKEIEQALQIGNATAHVEPCGNDECKICHAQEAIAP